MLEKIDRLHRKRSYVSEPKEVKVFKKPIERSYIIALVRGKSYKVPKAWDKEKVAEALSMRIIGICEICGKIDITLDHYQEKHY